MDPILIQLLTPIPRRRQTMHAASVQPHRFHLPPPEGWIAGDSPKEQNSCFPLSESSCPGLVRNLMEAHIIHSDKGAWIVESRPGGIRNRQKTRWPVRPSIGAGPHRSSPKASGHVCWRCCSIHAWAWIMQHGLHACSENFSKSTGHPGSILAEYCAFSLNKESRSCLNRGFAVHMQATGEARMLGHPSHPPQGKAEESKRAFISSKGRFDQLEWVGVEHTTKTVNNRIDMPATSPQSPP